MARRIMVLKFGSSVLRDDGGTAHAVHEIYREIRRGRRVVAVVSATGRTTDALLARAHALAATPHEEALAALMATGERTAAALLVLALDAAGIPARLLEPADVGLVLRGARLDAEPAALDAALLLAALRTHAVAVLPGFFGALEGGGTGLLGRGGSDCTALFVAQRLAARCRLLKDVDGVYDGDPARGAARRFRTLRFDDALGLGARVVQPKALALAQRHRQAFVVARPAAPARDGTRVGAATTITARDRCAPPPLRVAMLGLGSVGREVYRQLEAMPDRFRVAQAAVRDPSAHLARGAPPGLLTTDAAAAVRSCADVVVELMGGVEPTARLIRDALRGGRHVVTANKAVIAECAGELERLAVESGVRVLYSAAVAGAVPVLERVRQIARGRPVERLDAVLNGTTNFVLDRLADGATPEAALAEARRRGFAEADPTLDLDGTDAAQKLAIIARAAFGAALPWRSIPRRGIERVTPRQVRAAAATGGSVRLVASAWREGEVLRAAVAPRALPGTHPLSRVRNEDNLIIVRPAGRRPAFERGKGAGPRPTAEAVIADLLDLWRLHAARPRPDFPASAPSGLGDGPA